MPLSEHEQRILEEIERSFYDDATAPDNQAATGASASRNLKLSVVGFVAGLAIVLAFITTTVVAFAGFLVMLGSAFVFERNLRRLGRERMESIARSMKANQLGDQFGAVGRKM
ncbi:MAG: DUF3040 domain-containing protein, partial [Acidimicrobiia bacterium]